jgi:hypothetical protein
MPAPDARSLHVANEHVVRVCAPGSATFLDFDLLDFAISISYYAVAASRDLLLFFITQRGEERGSLVLDGLFLYYLSRNVYTINLNSS